MAKSRTMYDKIFDDHVVDRQDDGTCLLYIDRHLVHEVTSPQAFEGLRLTGRKVRQPGKTLAVVDHNVPTTDRTHGIEDPEFGHPGRAARPERARFRRRIFQRTRQAPGHRSRDRARAGFHPARHDDRVRRQPHLDARRVRRVGPWHRHVGSRARARNPDVDSAQSQELPRHGRWKIARRRDRERHHPVDHRRNRDRGRHRPRDGICRRGDPFAVDGRPHDGLQHGDRRRRSRRPHRAR